MLRGGAPGRPRGYARLLGTGDEFVAEVPLGEDGGFRFFAAPGDWTLRVLAPGGGPRSSRRSPRTSARSPRSSSLV